MSLNPQQYDLQELRQVAREDETRDPETLRSEIESRTEGEIELSDDRIVELLHLEASADPERLQRPYLESVPEQYTARLMIFEWLEFVLERAGRTETLDSIEYYQQIGWLGESAADTLVQYVQAFDDGGADTLHQGLLAPDHLVSLVYIARLAALR